MKYNFLYNVKNLPIWDEEHIKTYKISLETFIIKNFTITFKDKFMAESDKILAVGYFTEEGDTRTVNIERVTEIMKK